MAVQKLLKSIEIW